MARRVVVTGMGIITAHGTGKAVNIEAMREGRDSVRPITAFDASRYRGVMGCEAVDFKFEMELRRLKARRLDRATEFLITAFEEARVEAGLFDEGGESGGDCPVILGTTLGGMRSGERYHRSGVEGGGGGFKKARTSLLADYMAHTQPVNLKNEYEITGEAVVISDACASGTSAVGHAFSLVRSGEVPMAVCGGYDTMCEFTFAGFNSLQAVTPTVCRPFDKNRDGLVLGEGAAVLILESLDDALARGARPIGEVAGYGATSDAHHMTAPDPEGSGAEASMRMALEDAGVDPDEVDYINAHGTATPYNDSMEARAIGRVFLNRGGSGKGDSGVPVSSIKSMVGHILGGAGAVETAVCLMAMKEGFLPPNINCTEPEFDLNIVMEPGVKADLRTCLSNSFGFGGANATIVLKRFD